MPGPLSIQSVRHSDAVVGLSGFHRLQVVAEVSSPRISSSLVGENVDGVASIAHMGNAALRELTIPRNLEIHNIEERVCEERRRDGLVRDEFGESRCTSCRPVENPTRPRAWHRPNASGAFGEVCSNRSGRGGLKPERDMDGGKDCMTTLAPGCFVVLR